MNKPPLCSNCFRNEGIKREAIKVGRASEAPCSRCGTSGGASLDEVAARELFVQFFCHGSQAAAYLPRVFTMGDGSEADHDIQFEATCQSDYELLRQVFGLSVKRHTPRVYALGFTSTRSDIEEALSTNPETASDEVVEKFQCSFRALIDAGVERRFDSTQKLYRSRISPHRPLEPSEYDSPPLEKATPNRIAAEGRRVLCAALDIETCLVETKPHIDDIIHHRLFLAMLVPARPLVLLDFTQRKQGSTLDVNLTFNAFFEANQHSYHFTQLLGAFVKARGYDGVAYPSAMKCVAGTNKEWTNVALFDAPIADGRLRVESINRILVRNQSYTFDLGPAWDDDIEGNHLAPYLKGWLNRTKAKLLDLLPGESET